MRWEGRKRRGGWEGGEGRGGERGEDVEGPGKWSAPGPVLALGGPGHLRRGLKFGNAKRFSYIKFILFFCILSVRIG